MTLHNSTGKATKAQQARFERIKEIGCICCLKTLYVYEPPEIHHITDCGRRRGHDYTIGLCPWHHRGVSILPVRSHSGRIGAPMTSCWPNRIG